MNRKLHISYCLFSIGSAGPPSASKQAVPLPLRRGTYQLDYPIGDWIQCSHQTGCY